MSLEHARALARSARGRAKVVAVTVDPDDELADRIVEALRPDLLQLHGAESLERTRDIALRTGTPVIKALSIASPADLDAAAAYEGVADHLMFEPRPPVDADRPGGHGRALPFELLSERRFLRPWFLAGGLDPWNVRHAMSVSGAPLADVSSGVERGPGLKDPALIRAFLHAVRPA